MANLSGILHYWTCKVSCNAVRILKPLLANLSHYLLYDLNGQNHQNDPKYLKLVPRIVDNLLSSLLTLI